MTKHQDGTAPAQQHHRMLGEGGALSLCFSLSGSGEDFAEISDDDFNDLHLRRARQAQLQWG